MPNTPDTPSRETTSLPGRLDLTNAAALRDLFLEADGPLALDASDVEVVTTAGLQVLMAGRDWMADQGFDLRVVGATPPFRSCLKDLGADLTRITFDTSLPQGEVA
ncbi:MAG: STAS domain-containing protein [Pseudomonadota bacterium]